jgi:DNA polymerase III delta prime subunit
MSTPPDPTTPKPPGGIHVGDLSGERDVNVTLTDVAGGDQIKITNSPGATVIKEAPRKLSREEQLAQRNRQTMLAKVKAYWVDGVLANSLHSKVIPLDMERNPGAVTRPRPWDMLWQVKDQPPQPLPPGTHIIDRFQYMAGEALLILGEPGSGKTTMLLELAGDLLTQATQDESLRIPVVFNLSSWASKRLPLTDWLMAELQTLYLIPKKTAQTWVEQDDILPLLDGLDEVAEAQRGACIQAINEYRAKQGTPLVVCSRTADYEAMGRKLVLSDALILRPLTLDQINDYLLAGGPTLDGVRLGLQEDEVLQEMAQSPLMLSIMAVAYRDQAPEQFTSTNVDERGRQLFATYIQRQLHQRRKDPREDPATTLRQLTYLAHQMTTRDQTIFLIERLQPTWLPTPQQQSRYRWVVRLIVGLVFGLSAGLSVGLAFGVGLGLSVTLSVGLVLGLGTEMFFRLDDIVPVEKIRWSWRHISLGYLVMELVFWMGVGLSIGLAVELGNEIVVEKVVALVGGLDNNLIIELAHELVVGPVVGLIAGLTIGLSFGLVREWAELKTLPNEGIKNSFHNATRVGLAVGLVVGLIIGLIVEATIGLTVGLIFGAIVGLVVGGEAVIQHYTIRLLLHRYGYLPWKLAPFLDLAAERLILQKVGGGYRFTHRLLQDYLASLHPS